MIEHTEVLQKIQIEPETDIDKLNYDLWYYYLSQFYFVITTLTTIGYGDTSPRTEIEKLYIMFI